MSLLLSEWALPLLGKEWEQSTKEAIVLSRNYVDLNSNLRTLPILLETVITLLPAESPQHCLSNNSRLLDVLLAWHVSFQNRPQTLRQSFEFLWWKNLSDHVDLTCRTS